MHRQSLLNMLGEYKTEFPEEQVMQQRLTDFVKAHGDCFHRELSIGHITASAWIYRPAHREILLTLHTKLGKWLQPGGHCDGNSDVLAAAIREAEEETGLQGLDWDPAIFDIDIHEIPARKTEPTHFHYDVRFLARMNEEQALQISEESIELRWIPLNEMHRYNNNWSVMRMVEKLDRL